MHICVCLCSVIMYMRAYMRAVCIFYSILVSDVCEWKMVCLGMHAYTVARGLKVQILVSWQTLSRGNNHLLIIETIVHCNEFQYSSLAINTTLWNLQIVFLTLSKGGVDAVVMFLHIMLFYRFALLCDFYNFCSSKYANKAEEMFANTFQYDAAPYTTVYSFKMQQSRQTTSGSI